MIAERSATFYIEVVWCQHLQFLEMLCKREDFCISKPREVPVAVLLPPKHDAALQRVTFQYIDQVDAETSLIITRSRMLR